MKPHRRSLFALSALLLTAAAWASAADGEGGRLIEVRRFDEVVLKNGSVLTGKVFESDNSDEVRVRDVRTQATRPVKKSEIKEWRKAADLDGEINRLASEAKGRPDRVLRLCEEIVNYHESRINRATEILESEAGTRNPGILTLLVELQLRQGNNAGAQKYAEELGKAAPNSATALALRGQANLATGNLESAKKDLDKAAQMAPDDLTVIVARAEFFLRSGKPQEARDEFDRALSRNGKNLLALMGKGRLMLRQGEFAEADATFNQVLSIDPKHRDAMLGLAATKAMSGKPEECYSLCNEVLRYYPNSGEAYGLQAFSNLITGDPDLLPKFYQKMEEAFKEKPEQPRLLLAWAVALDREAAALEAGGNAGDLEKAAAKRIEAKGKYAEVLGSDAPDAYLQFFIGERKFRANDFAGAERAFQMVTKLAPRYAPAFGALGAVALRNNKGDVARDAYTAAIALDSGNAEYHAGLGLALLKAKKMEEASQVLGEALKRDKRSATALCGLGYIANFAKDKDRAVGLFQDALAADGNCEFAADALRRIYQQQNMTLEYVTFSDDRLPNQWKYRAAGSIRPTTVNGEVLFSGTQGTNSGNKLEIYRDLRAEEFSRIEADITVAPTSAVNAGVRIAAGAGGGVSFELELGKDESNEVKVRYRDFGGKAPVWLPVKIPWPADGRVRLALSTDDLAAGHVQLYVNGKRVGQVDLVLQKPKRITAGIFVQAPPREVVHVIGDNLVLVSRGAGAEEDAATGLTITQDEKPKQ
jgi:tetratricopeptide (TPR) repeat protein